LAPSAICNPADIQCVTYNQDNQGGVMPPASDWRSAQVAEKLLQLNRSEFAVEFLRRNPAYQRDYRRTLDSIASGSQSHDVAIENLARRWGLNFPASS
jgi:hypothetical protein